MLSLDVVVHSTHLCTLSLSLTLLLHTHTHTRQLLRTQTNSHSNKTTEFDRLLKKHATDTGLPVIVDFYSDGCGPCRMMAPIYKQLAKEVGQDKAVFVKIDTTTQQELSARYQIRSLPTFMFFLHGKKWDQFSGAGEGQLRQMTQQVIRQAEADNVELTFDSLWEYYQEVEPSKKEEDVRALYQKCADMVKEAESCLGAAANQLGRRLRKKYKSVPKMAERFSEADRQPGAKKETEDKPKASSGSSSSSNSRSSTASPTANQANLHLATKEQLLAEIEKRTQAEKEASSDEDDDDEEEELNPWTKGDFPEKVVIVGGGPAGMSAAIYAARAGLTPVVVAPPLGGQLQGKGVDVENYPGLANMTGPGVVASMRQQAASFGAVFESDLVVAIDANSRPLKVKTNSTTIDTHTIIVATGAESRWLGVPGEYALRGGGVSSCATCDGNIYRGKDVVVVGGGDTAMEEALVLARTSRKVTVIHRRDAFRASKVLATRVMEHPTIEIVWNSVVTEVTGDAVDTGDDSVDLDDQVRVVNGVKLQNTVTDETSTLATDAVFVAIGHIPTTQFLEGVVEFDDGHPGYVKTTGQSTRTSVPGIFAAGDVTDAVYRQAITSAGSGAAAALDAERYLSEEGLGNEAAEFEAELLAELMDSKEDEPRIAYNAYAESGGRMEGMKESVSAGEL